MRVVELFAGVGGFKLGLEGSPGESNHSDFKVIWANQWEPSSKKQHAVEVYTHRWGMNPNGEDSDIFESEDGDILVNKDIERVPTDDIPEHEILCGGFPCQDYSVARTLSGEMGIEGEKGKLWNSIKRILKESEPRPKAVFLENVPRLLNSPAKHRGLNFTVILGDLMEMGYAVEWRVINAADYGFPQKRKRAFILAYLRDDIVTPADYISLKDGVFTKSEQWFGLGTNEEDPSNGNLGPMSEAFPITAEVPRELVQVTIESNGKNVSPYKNTGFGFLDEAGKPVAITFRSTASFDGTRTTLGGVIEREHDRDYEITDLEAMRKFTYVKGEQKEWRIRKADADAAREIDSSNNQNLWDYYQTLTKSYNPSAWIESRSNEGYLEGKERGIVYQYSAGAMAFPDPLDRPSRTVVTAEVGRSVSRMRHVIEFEEGSFRRLMPIELERLNMFPDDWTNVGGISDSRRGFLMGNALVVGIVEGIAGPLAKLILRHSERGN